jgi:hypothetical protein
MRSAFILRRLITLLCVTGALAAGGCSGAPEGTGQTGGAATDSARLVPPLRAENVPQELRHLVPMAQRWGIGDDVARNQAVDRATAEEKAALWNAFKDFNPRITAWLDSLGQQPMTDEAAAFMYAQLALDEMGYTWK